MSQYVSPYAYRLPPDTFLQRRDPNWYIGAVTLSQAFKDQIALARSALRELASIAQIVQRAATNPGIAEAARVALEFANVRGPARLLQAEQTGDPTHLAAVQRATAAIFPAMEQEKIPAIVSRFLTILIVGPAGAILTADQIDKAKEITREVVEELTPKIELPGLPPSKNIPVWVWAAGGLTGLLAVAYIVGKIR